MKQSGFLGDFLLVNGVFVLEGSGDGSNDRPREKSIPDNHDDLDPAVHRITIRKSPNRSTWRIDGGGIRFYSLDWMHPIIEPFLLLLGIDLKIRNPEIQLSFAAEDFTDAQVVLTRKGEKPKSEGEAGVYYEVSESRIGTIKGKGFFEPAFLKWLGDWPEKVYVALAESEGKSEDARDRRTGNLAPELAAAYS